MNVFDYFFLVGERLGLMGWPLLVTSIIALAVMMERLLASFSQRPDLATAQQAMREGEAAIANLGNKGARALLTAHWAHREDSPEIRREAGQIAFLKWLDTQKRPLRTLQLIAQIAPLMGLTGTVLGLVRAFQIIQLHEHSISPALLAGGIWEALLTTVVGMIICIPCLIAVRYLTSGLNKTALTLRELQVSLDRQPIAEPKKAAEQETGESLSPSHA